MRTACHLAVALLSGIVLFPGCSGTAQNNQTYHVVRTFSLSGNDGWDYLIIEPGTNHLFVSHGTQVNIVDKKTGAPLGVIPNTTGVHGIAFVKDLGKGYVSNGRLNNVFVFDLKTFKVTGQIPTGENPDAINYEPFSKRIITCNGRSHNITVIDPVTDKVVATTDVMGKPEAAVSDGKGRLYINIEDKSEIAVIDAQDFSVIAFWPLAPGEEPTGLAFDPKTQRLFSGCDGLLMVVDATNGYIVDKLPIGDGCDGVGFDPATNDVFTSNGEGTITVVHERSANEFEVVENVPTLRGARTIAVDPVTHEIFVSTADYGETPAATTDNPRPRPSLLPDSFKVLVVAKQ